MLLRIIALLVYIFWILWWWRSPPAKVNQEVRQSKGLYQISKYANFALSILVISQLLGFGILPIRNAFALHDLIGCIIFLLGIGISIKARRDLGVNWTPGYNYHASKTITTTGIYQYIRHPIYLGIFLVYIGAELVARSYLSVVLLALLIPIYIQAKKEEKLLLSHFGKEYQIYMKKSKMFIPLVL